MGKEIIKTAFSIIVGAIAGCNGARSIYDKLDWPESSGIEDIPEEEIEPLESL